jgi:hypothetical protein
LNYDPPAECGHIIADRKNVQAFDCQRCFRSEQEHQIGGAVGPLESTMKVFLFYAKGFSHEAAQSVPAHRMIVFARHCKSDTEDNALRPLDSVHTVEKRT